MSIATKCLPVLLIVAFATTGFGQIIPGDSSSYPSVSIKNTPHNLNNFAVDLDIPGNQICLPCHVPHNALLSGSDNVLWNHAETGETFTMYFGSGAGQPEGPSKMCLGCHDGVTAIDNYGGTGGSGVVITGSAAMGTDLSNDHPIGVEYPTTGDYQDSSTFAPGIGGGAGVHLVTIDGAERVECTSCHQPHNNGLGNFLNAPLHESYLCLQCHIK